MQFPAFDHADFLDRAWRVAAPEHNIGGSSFVGGDWKARGLPALPTTFDSSKVNLRAEHDYQEAIARHMGTTVDRVFAAAGTSGGNLATMLWAYRPGCNMVVERPVYAQLAATAEGLGAEVRYVDRRQDDGWRLHPDDVAAACDDQTTLIILASPNNPTQAAASREDLLALGQIAERHDAHVLVDQVYRELTDDPIAAGVHERLITTAGFNKSWGALALRIGWLLAAPPVARTLQNVHMQTLMAPSSTLEVMATRLLPMASACREQLHARLAETLPIYRNWARETPGIEDPHARHLTAFPRLPVDDTAAFCERIARDPGVAMVPGEYFGRAGHARIGLGGDPDALRAGLDALAACLP